MKKHLFIASFRLSKRRFAISAATQKSARAQAEALREKGDGALTIKRSSADKQCIHSTEILWRTANDTCSRCQKCGVQTVRKNYSKNLTLQ